MRTERKIRILEKLASDTWTWTRTGVRKNRPPRKLRLSERSAKVRQRLKDASGPHAAQIERQRARGMTRPLNAEEPAPTKKKKRVLARAHAKI